MSLGSKGVGIRYSLPYLNYLPPYALATSGGTGSFASLASAIAAAIFIYSLICEAPVSSAPLNKKGKHITLLT
jgi:hypothetical protein